MWKKNTGLVDEKNCSRRKQLSYLSFENFLHRIAKTDTDSCLRYGENSMNTMCKLGMIQGCHECMIKYIYKTIQLP